MEQNISDFVQITRSKNGKIRIAHDLSNKANIYKQLHEQGFRLTKLANKRVFFRRSEKSLTPVSFRNIRDHFEDFLRETRFANIPDYINLDDILNWFYTKEPIKRNGLFDYYLREELSKEEQHELLLKIDVHYKHKYDVNHLLALFKTWSFSTTEDAIGYFCSKGTPLYFKKFDKNKYLVFVHYNSQKPTNDGFDCVTATYTSERHFNKKKPIHSESIRLNFRLERDYTLIEKYLENPVESDSR